MKVTAGMIRRIKNVYPGPTWSNRVDGMEERQIVEIYKRFERDGVFAKIEKMQKMKEQGYQISIWDYLLTEENDKGESSTNERNGADP